MTARNVFHGAALEAPHVASFLTLECFLLGKRHDALTIRKGDSMDPKITLLFMLIGTILGLSHLSDGKLDRMRNRIAVRRWREFVPGLRKE
jgi:hypothetical protein